MLLAEQGFNKLIEVGGFNKVLDVGCGLGDHTKAFRSRGLEVTPVDIVSKVEGCIKSDYMTLDSPNQECIWASHVLEHQLSPHLFLKKTHNDLIEGGLLAITVPPLKHAIVGGHLSLWNMGLLFYHLIMAGFDCSEARGKVYGYNITVILKKKTITVPPLVYDRGDIETLAPFAPKELPWAQNINGNIGEVNWTL